MKTIRECANWNGCRRNDDCAVHGSSDLNQRTETRARAQDHPLNLRFSPKRLTLALISHVFGARLGADSTQPIKIEALSRKLKLVRGAFRNERKIRGAFIYVGALLFM